MKTLAIDTSFEDCAVAVSPGDGDEPVILVETIGRGHAERLAPMVESAMKAARLPMSEIERIGVTVGPGSFTGLRVGIAAARGFALVLRCPVVGVGVLDAHAECARLIAGPVRVLAVLDARQDELYGQAFAADGTPIGAPEAAGPGHFAALLPGFVLAGSGSDLCAACLVEAPTIVHRRAAPDIRAVLALALRAPASDSLPRPLYLRPPDAKPQQGKGVPRR